MEAIHGLDWDWTQTPHTLFAAVSDGVYVSRSAGRVFGRASLGLPARAQATDLRFVARSDGSRYLVLGTYGWSLWRTSLR